jgi:hypothetical protein
MGLKGKQEFRFNLFVLYDKAAGSYEGKTEPWSQVGNDRCE